MDIENVLAASIIKDNKLKTFGPSSAIFGSNDKSKNYINYKTKIF